MTKQEQIRDYIIANNPTRKELIKFIVVNLNNRVTEEEYEDKDFRGYYSVGFCNWYRSGTVIRDKKTGRLSIHNDVLKYNLGLYETTPSAIAERLSQSIRKYNDMYRDNWNLRQVLESKNDCIKSLQRKINTLEEKSNNVEEKVISDKFMKRYSEMEKDRNYWYAKSQELGNEVLAGRSKITSLNNLSNDGHDPETGYSYKELYEMYRKQYTIAEMKLNQF